MEKLERLVETALDGLQREAEMVTTSVALAFVRKHPKRTIQLVDSMGVTDWAIDGKYLSAIEHRWVQSWSATDKSRRAYRNIFGQLEDTKTYLYSGGVWDLINVHTRKFTYKEI